MRNLKIGLGLVSLLLLLFFQLPASGFNQFENENRQIEPKIQQGDTVRITKRASEGAYSLSFQFKGEINALYKVVWGDGQETIETGRGDKNTVFCTHWYAKEATYNVLLFGIPSNEE